MKRAGPLGGLASFLLFLTGAPAGLATAMIWNSLQAGSRLWFDPVDTTLLVVILAWGPLWLARIVITSRRFGLPGGRRWVKAMELVALVAAVALFGLGFILAPTRMN